MNGDMPMMPSPEYMAKEQKLRELREKAWDSCTDSEKIEKLKVFVMDFNYLNNIIATLQSEVHRLKQHSHKENGDVVIPISSANNMGVGASISRLNTLN